MIGEQSIPREQVLAATARLTGISVGLIVLYAVLPLQSDLWWLGAVIGVAALAAVVPLTVRRTRAMRDSLHPMIDAAEALVLLVFMLVLGFSALYLTIDRDGGQFAGLDTRVDAVYFTVTTLSTVGFGDVSASGQAARLAVTTQILFDFTLLAVSVKMVVAAAQRRIPPSAG